jgi:hypothetical protein
MFSIIEIHSSEVTFYFIKNIKNRVEKRRKYNKKILNNGGIKIKDGANFVCIFLLRLSYEINDESLLLLLYFYHRI